MLSLKAAASKGTVSAWEIVRLCHLSACVFLTLSFFASCESSILFSSRNSSSAIFSPLQSVFLTSTPLLSGVVHGHTLRSTQEQPSLETTINSGFISGVHTGVYKPPIHTSEASTFSSLKTNVQLAETTLNSQSVADVLQSENRNAQSTSGGGLSHNLQTLQFTSDGPSMATTLSPATQSQQNTRMAFETITTFDTKGMINAQTTSSYNDFTSTSSSVVSIMPTALLQSSFKLSKIAGFSQTSEPARFSSILSSHEKFTGSISTLMSNLHVTSNVFSKDDLSAGKDRSKSTILSYYSTGIATQPQSVSSALPSVQETPQVLSSSISTAVAQDSSYYSSTAAPVDSSSYSSTAMFGDSSFYSSTAVPGDSSSSLTAFESYIISSSKIQHAHFTKATTASSFAAVTRVVSVQPSLSSTVAVQEKAPLTCKVNNVTCVCFNCEQARKNGKTCCMDLIDSRNIHEGVQVNMKNINVETFHQKAQLVSRVIEDVIWDSCKANSTICVSDENLLSKPAGARKRRSPQTELLENNSSSNNVRTKRESDSDETISQTLSSSVNMEALRPDINPFKTINISGVILTIYSISNKAGQPDRVQTAFYVTVTSFSNGTNQTQVLDGKGLLQILRDNKHILENRLNITIDSFSAWQSDDSETTSWTFKTTLVPNPSPGSQNLPTPLSTPEGRYL